MIGTVSMDALMRANPGGPGAFRLDASQEEVAEYFKIAGFDDEAGRSLLAAVFTPPITGRSEDRLSAWNKMNAALGDNAARVGGDLGKELLAFGTSLRFLCVSLALCTPDGTAEQRKAKLTMARTVFVSDIGMQAFKTGRRLPLPAKMKAALQAAESTDTSTLEGCVESLEHLRLLLKMTRAVAQHGPAALERFPG